MADILRFFCYKGGQNPQGKQVAEIALMVRSMEERDVTRAQDIRYSLSAASSGVPGEASEALEKIGQPLFALGAENEFQLGLIEPDALA